MECKTRSKIEREIRIKIKESRNGKRLYEKASSGLQVWGGPCTSVNELHHVLTGKDKQQWIVMTEMAYYAHTHKANKIACKELFQLNGIPYEEMLENLLILSGDEEHESTSTIANLPTKMCTSL